ncbi:MAG: hypothetical protein JWM18_2016 [Chloroflexi bacterium]|jgi:hypothetical protein|nr:hypothetical protein [Chloroflexota bacterium]
MAGSFRCEDCEAPARLVVDECLVCDRCGDRRIAVATGWPVLPDPAPPEMVIDADGREHRIVYRLLRTPGGITALAEEQGALPGEGYELSVLGPHDASCDQLTARIRERVRSAVEHRADGLLVFPGDAGAVPTGTSPAAPPGDAEEDEEMDDEALIHAWEEMDREAVSVLQHALPASLLASAPAAELASAGARLRAGLRSRQWPFMIIGQANGWRRRQDIPSADEELWLQAAGALVSMREESGLPVEEEASVIALQHADWLGAVLGLVRGGVGTSAEPDDLARAIAACEEIESDVADEEEEAVAVAAAFEVVLPVWEAVGAVDADRRLTALGLWGLPRALAQAWGGSIDAVVVTHRTVEGAPPGTRFILTEHYPTAPPSKRS